MRVILIETDVNNKIIDPGDTTVRRNENVAWSCEDFAFEVLFDPAKNPNNPAHPFKTTPPNPPPGDVTGASGEFHTRHVRPRSAATTIPNGTRYRYTITIKDPTTGAVVDTLDPDLIIDGDK